LSIHAGPISLVLSKFFPFARGLGKLLPGEECFASDSTPMLCGFLLTLLDRLTGTAALSALNYLCLLSLEVRTPLLHCADFFVQNFILVESLLDFGLMLSKNSLSIKDSGSGRDNVRVVLDLVLTRRRRFNVFLFGL